MDIYKRILNEINLIAVSICLITSNATVVLHWRIAHYFQIAGRVCEKEED